jgi:hypothetical protein
MSNVNAAEKAAHNAYNSAHAEHERLAALKKSLPEGANRNKATANFTKSQATQVAALMAWQEARKAKKAAAKPATAAGGRTRKQRSNRRRYTRKH